MKKIVLTGGGSAGHVVPNLALADELSDFELAYIGTDGIEQSLVTTFPTIPSAAPNCAGAFPCRTAKFLGSSRTP